MEEKQILTSLLDEELKESELQNLIAHSDRAVKKADRKKTDSKPPVESRDLQRVHVRIGSENSIKVLQGLSVISSTYQLSDKTIGVLGIMGPRRMEYSKMIVLVDYVSRIVNRLLKEFGEKEF